MRKITLLVIVLIYSSSIFAQKRDKIRKEIAKIITTKSTKSLITTLANDDMKGRESGTDGFDKAAAAITNLLRKWHINPLFDTYEVPFDSEKVTNGYNIVAVIKSKKALYKPIILSAHLDHLGIDKNTPNGQDSIYNGANDDASGVTAVLQIAQFLAKKSLNRDVIIALFGAEEKGLLGSKDLAKKLKSSKQEIDYMINFEMIGNTMHQAPGKAYLTGYDLSNLGKALNNSAQEPFVNSSKIDQKFKLFYRSDNYSFYETFKIPAHTLATFDFPEKNYYHQLEDEVAHLDIQNMNQIIQQAGYSIYHLLKSSAKIELKNGNN